MFAMGDSLPICLGECELTVRTKKHRALSEYPPLGLSEPRLRRMRAQAAQLIFGTGWKGIISARFLVTPDGRAYFYNSILVYNLGMLLLNMPLVLI